MEQLKAARADLGMTQAQLAEALGITQGTLSRMENGLVPINKRTELALSALCAARRVTPAESEAA